jgi:hypothetical protein
MKKSLLLAIAIATGIAVIAQAPTVVTTATNCTVFRNFNTSDEGFSSPSIYSSAEDVQFSWNAGAGAEIESSGLNVRSGSLISPVYVLSSNNQLTVGFRYAAPANTEFRIRIISALTSPPLEILATTANGPVYTSLPATSGNICLLLNDADLTIGREIRVEFTFRANLPGNILFDDLALTVAGGPLPVLFQGFVARKNADGTLKLLWDVGTETNVKGYYVESSTNGVDFTTVGYVPATGSKIYSLDYNSKLVQTMFFRVKNVDFDGRSKYTPIIKVYAKEQTDAQIQVYPNPATDMVTIQHRRSAENSKITLISPDGKVLQQVVAVANTFQTQVNVSTLTSGLYIVRYDDGKGAVQTAKILKN